VKEPKAWYKDIEHIAGSDNGDFLTKGSLAT